MNQIPYQEENDLYPLKSVTIATWEKTGLLHGLDDLKKREMVGILHNQKQCFFRDLDSASISVTLKDYIAKVSMMIARMTFEHIDFRAVPLPSFLHPETNDPAIVKTVSTGINFVIDDKEATDPIKLCFDVSTRFLTHLSNEIDDENDLFVYVPCILLEDSNLKNRNRSFEVLYRGSII